MGRTWCALALGIIASTTAFGQNQNCTVGKGETLSQIAARYGVPTVALAHANCIKEIHKLKLGQVITVPASLHPKDLRKPDAKAALRHVVGIPGAPVQLLAISLLSRSQAAPAVSKHASARKPASTKVASGKGRAPAKTVAIAKGKTYKVVDGDNDWVVARKFSTKPSLIRAANPNIDWSRLKIGTVLRLPDGSTKVAKAAKESGNVIRTRRAVVAKDAVNIRRGPSAGSAVVTTVDRGTSVTVLDRESGWYKLKFPRGTVGWVRGDMLKAASAARYASKGSSKSKHSGSGRYSRGVAVVAYNAKTGNAVADSALKWIGTRYRYGSASRSATDCSALVMQVYRQYGVHLPRRSRDQSQVGATISRSSLKPGDLVFFHTGRSKRVNHAGMFIGDGKFVHASSAKGRVRVDKLSDGYYSSRFVVGRRVKGAKVTEAVKAAKRAVSEKAAEPKVDTSAAKPVGEHRDTDDAGIK